MTYLLNELINSLGAVLIRYHDSQKNLANYCVQPTYQLTLTDPAMPGIKRTIRLYAKTILETENFAQKFNDLNKEVTENYTDRLEFLTFIKDEIETLKRISLTPEPFTQQDLEDYQKKIAQLFIDLSQLLSKQKTESYMVKIIKLDGNGSTSLELKGLIDAGVSSAKIFNYFKQSTSGYCISGDFILEEVFNKFGLTATSTQEEIKDLAKKLCESHQEALLVRKKLADTETALKETRVDLKESKKALIQKDTTIQEQALELTDLQIQLQHKEQELAEAQAQITSLPTDPDASSAPAATQVQSERTSPLPVVSNLPFAYTGLFDPTQMSKTLRSGIYPSYPFWLTNHVHRSTTTSQPSNPETSRGQDLGSSSPSNV